VISGDSAADKTLPPSPQADGLGQVPTRAPFSEAAARVPVARRTVLEPPARWSGFEFRELWQYRELLYILAWRDIKVRYKQATLGAAWAVVQPLVMMGIFTLVFSRIGNVSTQDVPYPVFAFAGLVPWTVFANALASSSMSLVNDVSLVSKVYFPRLVIPVSSVVAWIPDFIIGSLVLLVIMAVYGTVPMWTGVLLPLVLMAVVVATLSVAVWLSALNVAYRDVRYVVPFLIQVWLFLTPVAYPTASIPAKLSWLAGLNPMTWVVDLSRWVLLGTSSPWHTSLISVATTVVLFVSGMYHFRRVQQYFADVI
jgi:lipopolysaccharide transport system permease protein